MWTFFSLKKNAVDWRICVKYNLEIRMFDTVVVIVVFLSRYNDDIVSMQKFMIFFFRVCFLASLYTLYSGSVETLISEETANVSILF